MQRPKGRQYKRIIDCLRAGPDFLQAQRPDHARIVRQMRFIVPNEARPETWLYAMKTRALKNSAQNQSRLQNETRISRTGTN